MNLDILETAGINTSELMQTLMGNEEILKVVLDKFLADKNFGELERLFSLEDSDIDYESIELYAHTLKGASATLEMTSLHRCLQTLVDNIRTEKYDGLRDDFMAVSSEYYSMRDAILEWKVTEGII